ncbi:MAG: hypothetical protein Q8R55_03975 [Candidatus Taylorbacteria bacterium]|nr:hypothetical protein [Candidatus Taylorbacteria bacterium]
MSMNRGEYVQYFNPRQPPNCRKISTKILELYEVKNEHSGDYNQHISTLERVREFLSTVPLQQYLKFTGGKQKRRREPSLFKNTILEIKAFPIEEEVNHHWSFLAHDFENKQKYFWDQSKKSRDEDKNQNQIYFNQDDIIQDFLTLDLKGFPFSNDEKLRIIKFLEKYGPYFIGYMAFESNSLRDREWYFWHFWNDFDNFKKSYEIIKKRKPPTFPHAKTPSRILEQLYNRTNLKAYTEWQENISRVQLWFNMRRTETPLPTRGVSPLDFTLHGNRGIGVICSYLYQNCNKLIQCPYSLCKKDFFQSRKNQVACCPNHSLLLRTKKYKEKMRK